MQCGLNLWPGPEDFLPDMSWKPIYDKILMICMPFQGSGISSLSTALLSTLLRKYGVAVDEGHFHLDFAEITGFDHYRAEVDNGRALWERYNINLFATDTILSQAHLKEVMPRLASFDSQPTIFYEVKSNMSLSDVRALRAANVSWIQPGIESLSTTLLKLIRKGVTAIQNIAFLKWCREEKIHVAWNMLCSIPGESLADYEDQLRLMPLIFHLEPPSGVSPIRVDRYSPYYNSPEEFGWSELRPMADYRRLHPHLAEADLAEIAYYFEGLGGDLRVDDYFGDIRSVVDEWKHQYSAGNGLFWDDVNGLVRVEGEEAIVFERCAALDAVIEATHEVAGLAQILKIPDVDEPFLDQLTEKGILYREGRRLVNLAVRIPAELMGPSAATDFPDPRQQHAPYFDER